MYKVIIVEDDLKISEIQSRFVEKIEGFELVAIANTIAEANDVIDVFQPDLVLLDITFPDGSGLDLMWNIRQHYKSTDVILITAAREVNALEEAIRGGVYDFILKPMTFTRFQDALIRYVEHREQLNYLTKLEQASVDRVFNQQSSKAPIASRLPKGIDMLTLDKVKQTLSQLPTGGKNGCISAEVMGEKVGISRTTARRYLEYLVSQGLVEPDLSYGTVGRPERVYHLTR